MFGFIIFWVLCGVIAGMIGSQKGAGCLSFFLGFALGPFGVIIVLLMGGNRKKCPYCMELINKDAKVCPKCQRDQPIEDKKDD